MWSDFGKSNQNQVTFLTGTGMNETLKTKTITLLKGMGIGTANVIPGVSGATIAIITGVFERLIHAIKSCDVTAVRHLFSGRFKAFSQHIDLGFLAPLMLGVVIAILSLARLLEFLFSDYPVYIWSYFFGLILGSVYFVGKSVEKWTLLNSLLCVGGIAFAVALTYANPAVENRHMLYVFLCGIIAICSMILPGISGSFVLILMGNYELIVFEGISGFRLGLLLPFLLGCGLGLIGFSHILSWILDRFKHQTIATLTGFITGSLLIIWPWKKTIFKLSDLGEPLLKDGEPVVFKYLPILPDGFSSEVILALVIVAVGIASIWVMEYMAGSSKTPKKMAS
jgi:putative membrane protein